MTLTDPLRPLMGGRPRLLSFPAVVPELMVWPLPEAVRVSTFLAVTHDSFSRFQVDWPTNQLPQLLLEYATDPEATLVTVFNWTPPTAPASRSLPTLEELGLLT